MEAKRWPTISVVTPTLNSQRTLTQSLQSVINQNYPGRVGIVIADGGSTDGTLKIAKKFRARIIKNKLKTGEAGKAAGAKIAKGEILAFVDSDNILPSPDWLNRLVEPFIKNKEIVASEPLLFSYRKNDHWLTRYFALLGMGDPLNLFIGNYDRYSLISDRWTDLKINFSDEGRYLTLTLTPQNMPTIGANGFLIRKKSLSLYPIKDYLFDIDVLKFLAIDNPIKVAKVKTGIIHLFTGDISTFIRKQRRRIRDYLFYQRLGVRAKEPDRKKLIFGIIKFVFATVIIIPLLFQALIGYKRKSDIAWFFHPFACLITLFVYSFEFLATPFAQKQFSRKKWSQ